MKCKHCDGTGKSNMYKDGEFVDCMYCDGTGEVQMTNDEWRRTCPTEEFAEFLNFIAFDWNRVDKQWVLEWLNSPHEESKH